MSARLDPRGLEVWMGKRGRLDAKEKAFFFFGDEEDEPLLACSRGNEILYHHAH